MHDASDDEVMAEAMNEDAAADADPGMRDASGGGGSGGGGGDSGRGGSRKKQRRGSRASGSQGHHAREYATAQARRATAAGDDFTIEDGDD